MVHMRKLYGMQYAIYWIRTAPKFENLKFECTLHSKRLFANTSVWFKTTQIPSSVGWLMGGQERAVPPTFKTDFFSTYMDPQPLRTFWVNPSHSRSIYVVHGWPPLAIPRSPSWFQCGRMSHYSMQASKGSITMKNEFWDVINAWDELSRASF